MTRLGRVPAFPTLRHAIDAAAAALAEAGVGSPRTDAELLAAHAAGTDRGRLAFADIGPGFRERYDGLVAQRTKRVPLQHLTGTAAFGPVTRARRSRCVHPATGDGVAAGMGCGARVVASSGHRRPVHRLRRAGARAARKNWPDARVIAVDDSDDALAYARRNTAGTPVESIQADVTAPGLLAELDGQVDLVVANPPYIPDGSGTGTRSGRT